MVWHSILYMIPQIVPYFLNSLQFWNWQYAIRYYLQIIVKKSIFNQRINAQLLFICNKLLCCTACILYICMGPSMLYLKRDVAFCIVYCTHVENSRSSWRRGWAEHCCACDSHEERDEEEGGAGCERHHWEDEENKRISACILSRALYLPRTTRVSSTEVEAAGNGQHF